MNGLTNAWSIRNVESSNGSELFLFDETIKSEYIGNFLIKTKTIIDGTVETKAVKNVTKLKSQMHTFTL